MWGYDHHAVFLVQQVAKSSVLFQRAGGRDGRVKMKTEEKLSLKRKAFK